MSYPDDPAARVLALVEGEGYSASKAAEIVGVPGRTARMWVRNAMPLTADNKPILDKWRRRVDQALDLIEDGLDKIEEDDSGQAALKNLTTLNIIAGTGTDKLQKDQEHTLKNRSNEAAHSLADAINRLATLDTSHLAGLIEAEYEVKDA